MKKLEKKINILMISSNADLGGGPKQMFSLGENLDNCFKVFYAHQKIITILVFKSKQLYRDF